MSYADTGPDPRYPNRPTHRQFHRMARLAQDLDGDSGRWPQDESADAPSAFLSRNELDEDSVQYMMKSRCNKAVLLLGEELHVSFNSRQLAVLQAAWFDGFSLGYEFKAEEGA